MFLVLRDRVLYVFCITVHTVFKLNMSAAISRGVVKSENW